MSSSNFSKIMDYVTLGLLWGISISCFIFGLIGDNDSTLHFVCVGIFTMLANIYTRMLRIERHLDNAEVQKALESPSDERVAAGG